MAGLPRPLSPYRAHSPADGAAGPANRRHRMKAKSHARAIKKRLAVVGHKIAPRQRPFGPITKFLHSSRGATSKNLHGPPIPIYAGRARALRCWLQTWP